MSHTDTNMCSKPDSHKDKAGEPCQWNPFLRHTVGTARLHPRRPEPASVSPPFPFCAPLPPAPPHGTRLDHRARYPRHTGCNRLEVPRAKLAAAVAHVAAAVAVAAAAAAAAAVRADERHISAALEPAHAVEAAR